MNENSFDENNLLYVRKNYEVEVTEKARKIFADNTVQTTLDETNKKLDELIAEMNEKLGFVTQKMVGENGVEEYVKDVHNQIDNTAVDVTQLVDSGIVRTGSHPSITTFKNNRSETKYKTYDFINKTIDISFKDQALRFYNNTDINDDDKVHAFNIHMDDIEHLKIIEFAFTYSQFPDIVKIVDGDVYREPTTKINRVFYGRFFIIRHDPVNAPDEIIVKAIVENADNTGNVVDEYAIDVKKSNIEDKISLKNEIGPVFDIYFRIASRNDLLICIGNINPYKYLLQKTYVESNKQVIDNFNLLKSGIEAVKFDKVFYSGNQQKVFIVDTEHSKVYIIPAIDKFSIDNISMDNATVYDKLTTDGFFVKDVGSYTFIGDNSNHCYVYPRSNFTEYTDLGVNVEDVQLMSTNEIIVQVGSELNGRKISRLYMFNYSTSNINTTIFGEFHVSTSDINFIQKNKFIEFEPGKIILVSNSRNGSIYYKFLRYNNSTNTYTNDAIESATVEQKIDIEELESFDTKNDGTSLDLILSETGLFIHLNYESEINGKKTVVLSVRDLQINISNYTFKHIDILKKYNKTTNISYSLTDVIKKIVSTSLLTFGITDENKLLIIDDNYIIEALNFVPVEENDEVKGYSDKDSVLYMKPVEGEDELYLIDKPYLQDVKAIYQSFKGNIYILDGKGVYELTTTKNLVCKFWTDDSTFTDIVVNKATEAYIISEKDGKQNIFCHNFDYDDSSSKKLRHKYFDLINGDYEKYDPDSDYTDYSTDETVMIDFKAKLYCTLIDKMSAIYNSKDTYNMYYTNNTYTFNDINPAKPHNLDIVVNSQSVTKNITISKFTLSTNKYGFINYFGFTLLNTSNLSDINDENLYVLIHKSGDNLSIADYREVIYRLIKEQTIKENDKYDSQGNLKPGYETTISVTKKYKSVNKNRVFRHPQCTISHLTTDYNDSSELKKFEHGKFKGSLLSDKFSYIYKDTIYNLAQTRTEIGSNNLLPVYEKFIAGKLPVTFKNSCDDEDNGLTKPKYSKRIDPFNVVYNKINYFVGYVAESSTVTNLVVVKEASSKSTDGFPAMTVVKTLTNVISARAINNELYYSKSNGGLFCLDDELEEVEKVSPELGYIFYDFTELNGEIYGITNNGVLVKINKDNPRLIPDVIIGDSNITATNEQVLADIYNFENSDKLIIRISHVNDNITDLYVPYIYVISKSNVNEYTIIQKPFRYNKYTDYETLCKSSKDFVFKFVEINNTIFAQGSNNFIFNEKTLSFETFENTLPLENSIAPISYWSSTEFQFQVNNKLSFNDCLIKTPYGIGCFVPYTKGNVAIIIDDVSKEFIRRELTPVDSENSPITDVTNIVPNGTIIGRISNNISSGKKYRIEVLKNGKVCINGGVVSKIDNNGTEQTLDSLYTASDINAEVYKNNIQIEKDIVSGSYIIKDIDGNVINLFKLNHERCVWNSLKFEGTVTVGQLINKHIIPYRYVVDDASTFVKVDTDVVKYPIPGIKYYIRNTVGSYDTYEQASEAITKWEVNSAGKVEYFEPKHHYEMMTNVAESIVSTSYVFICENRYFTKVEITTNETGELILPNTEEYYILSTKSTSVDLSKVIDERAVFILNDDKILLHAKVDDTYKTIIYDTYLENDFTRHDIWDRVYPKAGFDIKRIWETSRGKFAVINIPCYDHYFLGLISDDLQLIYCKLNYDIDDPGCVHLIDTEKELLISIATSDYTNVVNYIYDDSFNKFVISNIPLICIDSVEIEGKTYIAAIKNNRDSTTDTNFMSFSIYDIDKNLLLSVDKGITIPVYNTTRNSIKQFDNVFVKRTNSITGKEEAYVFFTINTSKNDTSDDSVYDCIHISGNIVQLEDLNFLAYTKFGDANGKPTFVNTMLTPENKILLICSYSAIFSLEEDGSINVITGLPSFIKPINNNGNDLVNLGDIVFKNTHSNIPNISSIEDDENKLPSTYNWHYYNPVNNTYLVDSSEYRRDDMLGYFEDRPLLINHKFYLTNIFQKCYVSEGNVLDPFDVIFKYIMGDNEIKSYSESSIFISDPKSLINQKCLPVAYKDTMVFGTSVLDEQTGRPSSNWFSIYDSDKTTLISDFICFDYLFVTKSGKMFGVYGSNIYENNDVLSSPKWFKVQGGSAHECEYTINGLVYNTFKKMIETKYGIFYFDSKNILKYNEETDIFEVVPHEFDLTSNNLNFAESFDTGLFIGNKRDDGFERRRNDAGFDELDFSTTGINFNYYDPKQNEFVALLPSTVLTTISKMSTSRIVDIQETSRGVFILYCANDNTYKNTIFRCYLSVYNVLLWEECKYKTTFNLLDGSSYTNEYPCNHSQVWEDTTTNTIWISGTAYIPADATGMLMSDYQNTDITIGRYSGAWAYRKFMENDNSDYRHDHGIDFRFEPNISNTSLNDSMDTTSVVYARKYDNPLFDKFNGSEKIISTDFGNFVISRYFNYIFGSGGIYKINGVGTNDEVKSISYFEYKQLSTSGLTSDIRDAYYLKEINGKLFVIFNGDSNIPRSMHILEYDFENNKFIPYYAYGDESTSVSGFDEKTIADIELAEYNGILYMKPSNDSNIYMFGDRQFDGVTSSPESESNDVLYELRAIFDNQDSYNNLVEKTDNSNLDKFVFKEIGIIDGITGIAKHIFQYFEPNEFYNEADGVVKPLITKPREFHQSNSIKQLYKNIYQKFNSKNLINNRFLKQGQTIIADGFKHEVSEILGDVENYLVNTDNARIELKIYPVETEDFIDSNIKPCKFGITTSVADDESGIEPFDPYD